MAIVTVSPSLRTMYLFLKGTIHHGLFACQCLVMDSQIANHIVAADRVFQERLLSRRILYFEKHEITWECREAKWCECGSDVTEANYRKPTWSGHHIEAKFFEASPLTTYESTLPTAKDSTTYAWWRNTILQQYTTLQLTKHTDRLPALSGLAAVVKEKTKDVYLAGIWKSDLAQGLLWRPIQDGLAHPPEQQIAPSWSWANIGPIETGWFDLQHSLVTLVKHDVRLATTDEMGSVSSGKLRLRCPLIERSLQTPLPGKITHHSALLTHVEMPLRRDRARISLDGPSVPARVQIIDGSIMTIVRSANTESNGSSCHIFLAVLGTGSIEQHGLEHCSNTTIGGIVLGASLALKGAYQRIGCWWTDYVGSDYIEFLGELEQYAQTFDVV